MHKLTSKILKEFTTEIRGSSYQCQILDYKSPIKRKNFKWCTSCIPASKLISGTICARLVSADDGRTYYLCSECTKVINDAINP